MTNRHRLWLPKIGVLGAVLLSGSACVVSPGEEAPEAVEKTESAVVAPAYTLSRYMSTTSSTVLYAEGRSLGQSGQSGLVILDFGQAWVSSGVYGSQLYSSAGFRSTSQIVTAAENFLQGFWDYSPAGAFVKLGIGTNNYHGATTSAPYAHGSAWGSMVNTVNNWIASKGYGAKLGARGANDIEPWCSLGCQSAASTRSWIDGYASVSSAPMYNYGSVDGCPPYGSCSGDWTQEDVWYWSWGKRPAWPVPEIYATGGANAQQWYSLSLYAYTHHGARMDILGSLTQYNSCTSTSCPGTNNTPSAGYTQLYNALYADTRTRQALSYSTDITYSN